MKTIINKFDYEVDVIENLWIPLADGTQLSCRMWRPRTAERVPVVLEYIPYRKRDGTRTRDEPMHGYFAGKGFAVARVDMRGCGESGGVMHDEYLRQEQDDALEVIAWLAAQEWCNGRVGMMGKSWGGFNSLQVAARQPEALRAIICVGFTDDRYREDIHYKGGCLLNDNFWWGAIMLAYQSRGIDPQIKPDARDEWLTRLRAMPDFAAKWTRQSLRSEYWKHGSVCEDYSRIKVPVFAIDGWADSYKNTVFSLLRGLSPELPKRGVIGPWAHVYAHDGYPAPAMDFLGEATAWWDKWLRDGTGVAGGTGGAGGAETGDGGAAATPPDGGDFAGRPEELAGGCTGVAEIGDSAEYGTAERPHLQLWLEEPYEATARRDSSAGRWVSIANVHAPGEIASQIYATDGSALVPAGQGDYSPAACSSLQPAAAADAAATQRIDVPAHHGICCGEWMGAGVPGEAPLDQRRDNALSLCFDTAAFAERTELAGYALLRLRLRSSTPRALLYASICDVAPSGVSTRIAYGALNLAHTAGHEASRDAREWAQIALRLDMCAYALAPGHRLRLSLANHYWPMFWPASAEPNSLEFAPSSLRLELPIWRGQNDAGPCMKAASAPLTPLELLSPGRIERTISYDVLADEITYVTNGVGGVFGEGVYRFKEADVTVDHSLRKTLKITGADPSSARYEIAQTMRNGRPGYDVRANITTTLSADAAAYHFGGAMEVFYNDELVFSRDFTGDIQRD